MKVRLNDINRNPVEIYCADTDELEAAIDVLQDKGILPEIDEAENGETENEPQQEVPAGGTSPVEAPEQEGG